MAPIIVSRLMIRSIAMARISYRLTISHEKLTKAAILDTHGRLWKIDG